MLQLAQITEWASFVNDSPRSHQFLPFLEDSDRSYSHRVHFILAVFVSSPYLETNWYNQIVVFFSETSISYRILGNQALAPFLEYLCWGYLSITSRTMSTEPPIHEEGVRQAEPALHKGLQVRVRQTEPNTPMWRTPVSKSTNPKRQPQEISSHNLQNKRIEDKTYSVWYYNGEYMSLYISLNSEQTIPRVNPKVKYRRWVIMMSRLTNCNKCTTLVGDSNNGGSHGIGVEGIWEIFVLSSFLLCLVLFSLFLFFFFFWLCLQHREFPWPEMESSQQQWLKPLQWQCQILNLLWHKRTPGPSS